MNGAFPLTGFMRQKDYESVVNDLRLADGTLFMVVVLTAEVIWQPSETREADKVYNKTSAQHPGVRLTWSGCTPYLCSCRIEGIQAPFHHDFENLWDTLEEMRALFRKMGWRRVVAFQTSKPMHRLQREIIQQAAKDIPVHILLHPTMGLTKPTDL